jgi:hypothetical protein
VWDATTTFERTASWYRAAERGEVESRADIERYARRAAPGCPGPERIAEAA